MSSADAHEAWGTAVPLGAESQPQEIGSAPGLATSREGTGMEEDQEWLGAGRGSRRSDFYSSSFPLDSSIRAITR